MRLPIAIRRHLGAIKLVLASMGVAALFAACGTPGGQGPSGPGFGAGAGSVKVALLLPISAGGSTPGIAKALKQAGELALFDFDNPNVVLVPKDTGGTPEGARMAAESAVQDGAELIIGPLFAQEVNAVAPIARQAGIPVVAFSSDENVAGNGVYLLSFVAGRDVQRIVSFALSRGKRNFAVLVPQSPYGRLAETAFARAVSAGGGTASVRAVFPPGDANGMLGPVRQIANAVKGGQQVDALFLPAGREELPSLAPLLASSGLSSAQLQFLGTGQWDFPNIGTEKALIGGWYPAPDPKGWAGFSQRYAKTYGGPPPRIASLAYDAVSLAVSLSQNPQGQRYNSSTLSRASGFQGVDGLFRLLPGGTSERGLAILEVREYGPQVIDPAPSSFSNAQSSY
ncbi:MAG: penicillin-binding protein activator [Methyloceanibacter sp.]|uniref:penicillin-binding protein activator n=1 Tax=Methyloceanibacter sp. TaxID=1965321 RepID=UPI003D9BE5CA